MTRYDLTRRTVVLTGSTGGLGAALAQALRARGANLALLDLNAETSAAQAQALGGATVARGWRADVRDLTSLQTAMARRSSHRARSSRCCSSDELLRHISRIPTYRNAGAYNHTGLHFTGRASPIMQPNVLVR